MQARLATLILTLALSAQAQHPNDPALAAANDLIGRALILRCLCAEDALTFDAEGHPQQPIKAADWTLSGVNLQKAERKDPATIELQGIRVASRYIPDRREFERHNLPDEKIKILLPADPATGPTAFAHTLDAVFSEGIDLRLQRSMPAYWLHYFLPQTPWPPDDIATAAIVTPGTPAAPHGLTDPHPIHRGSSSYTPQALHDRVQGSVLIQLVVDTAGQPRRLAIAQPLGYGLDARTIESIQKDRFDPATTPDGKPVPANVQVRQQFTITP